MATERKFVTEEKILNWFKYHPPLENSDQGKRYNEIRGGGHTLATLMFRACPESPELTTAINKLRESIFWANASIACNE